MKNILLNIFLIISLTSCTTNQERVIIYEGKTFEKNQELANQGNMYAQNNLGFMYLNGQDVERNYQKAFEWYKKSADQGFSNAQVQVGILYTIGRGTKIDKYKAYEYILKALHQKNEKAPIMFEILCRKFPEVCIDTKLKF